MTDTGDIEILISSPGPLHFSSQFWSVFHSRTGIRYARATTHQLRTHPEAIALFREMGSEWCSAYDRTLSIWTIPKVFEKYWAVENENDADSDEVCVIRVDDACADLCVSAHERLHAEYTALKETFKAYMDRVRTNVKTSHETQGETVKAEKETETETKPETNNDGDGVHTYSYFGC